MRPLEGENGERGGEFGHPPLHCKCALSALHLYRKSHFTVRELINPRFPYHPPIAFRAALSVRNRDAGA
jgi:hypothetical protein